MKLSAAKRSKIPKGEFAEPGERKYPIEDKAHAVNAKSRAKQQFNRGRISQSLLAQITSKANRKLG